MRDCNVNGAYFDGNDDPSKKKNRVKTRYSKNKNRGQGTSRCV